MGNDEIKGKVKKTKEKKVKEKKTKEKKNTTGKKLSLGIQAKLNGMILAIVILFSVSLIFVGFKAMQYNNQYSQVLENISKITYIQTNSVKVARTVVNMCAVGASIEDSGQIRQQREKNAEQERQDADDHISDVRGIEDQTSVPMRNRVFRSLPNARQIIRRDRHQKYADGRRYEIHSDLLLPLSLFQQAVPAFLNLRKLFINSLHLQSPFFPVFRGALSARGQ